MRNFAKLTPEEAAALCYLTKHSGDRPPNYNTLCESLAKKGLAQQSRTRLLDDPDHVDYEYTAKGVRQAREICAS